MWKLFVIVIVFICHVKAEPEPDNNSFFGPDFPFTNFQKIKMPEIKIPDIKIPEIKIPKIKIPEIKIPEIKIPKIEIPTIKPLTPEDIEKLTAVPGGSVTGISQTVTTSTVYVNGQPVTKTEGIVIVNRNGNVSETKFGN